MILCGIDPGLTGAIAFIHVDHGLIAVDDLPTMAIDVAGPKTTVKREIDVQGLRALVHKWVPADTSSMFAMEHASAMGMPGLQAATSLAATKASIMAVLRLSNFDVKRIPPQTWKRFYGLGSDKSECLAIARKLFGMTGFERAKDHNRAESALIAHYVMRTMS